MCNRPYPSGIDCIWLASDQSGHLGAFVTAGVGPIPIQVLGYVDTPIEDIEHLILDMPQVSIANLLIPLEQPDSFIKLAERGIFVFDWSDVYRTLLQSIDAYEPIASPVSPITLDVLSGQLAEIAKSIKFNSVAFVERKNLDVRKHMICQECE